MSVIYREGHKPIFDKLFARLEVDYDIASIIGFGSYFNPTKNYFGDIDLIFLVNNVVYEKFFTFIDGFEYDVTLINKDICRRKLNIGHQFFLRSFQESVIIFDQYSYALTYKKLADAKVKALSLKPGNDKLIMLLRSRVRTLLLDLEDNIDNDAVFELIFCSLVCCLRDAACLIYGGLATTYAKNALTELSTHKPEAATMIETALLSDSNAHKFTVSRSVSLDILYPVGGLLKHDEVISLYSDEKFHG